MRTIARVRTLGTFRVVVLLFASGHAQAAFGQAFLIGVKGGTPLSDAGLTTSVGSFRGIPSSGTAALNVRRYTIGPTAEFGLPLRLRLQADALYKRVDQTDDRDFVGLERRVRREKANSWEFPVTVKYGWDLGATKQFVSGGGGVRWVHFSENSEEIFRLSPSTQPYSRIDFPTSNPIAEAGWVTAGGVRFDVGVMKIVPEVRYIRWKTDRSCPHVIRRSFCSASCSEAGSKSANETSRS
jgi:hypothetical protein